MPEMGCPVTPGIGNESADIYLSDDSSVPPFLQRLRDEARSFTIAHNELPARKLVKKSKLNSFSSMPLKRKQLLRVRFHTMAGIRSSTAEEITAFLGRSKA